MYRCFIRLFLVNSPVLNTRNIQCIVDTCVSQHFNMLTTINSVLNHRHKAGNYKFKSIFLLPSKVTVFLFTPDVHKCDVSSYPYVVIILDVRDLLLQGCLSTAFGPCVECCARTESKSAAWATRTTSRMCLLLSFAQRVKSA